MIRDYFLVPKLRLGTQLDAKFYLAKNCGVTAQAKLGPQGRSQVQLGNEKECSRRLYRAAPGMENEGN